MKPFILPTFVMAGLVLAVASLGAQTQSVEVAKSSDAPPTMTLEKGDRLVILGDSISAMCKYTILLDLYLAATRPDLEVWMFQDAISGEVTAKLLRRLDGTLERTKPTVAISFYGVNDAGWTAFDQEKADKYEADTRALLAHLKKEDVRVLLASTTIMGDGLKNSKEFNATLRQFREITQRIASDTQTPFTDVNTMVRDAQDKMRARPGESADYDIVARDGAHADWQAHMAIVTAMLRGLGMGKEPIAQITFDVSSGQATASEGHRIVEVQGDTLTVESSRYPFFFLWENPAQPYQDMPKVAQEVGFFDDLNRFMLVVKGLTPGDYRVTWGKVSERFTADQLAAGVNLAAAFRRTPFDAQLYKLWQLCLVKGIFDVNYTIDAVYKRDSLLALKKQLASQLPDQSEEDVVTMIGSDPMQIHDMYVQRQRELVQPVSYSIRIVAE